MDLRIEDELGQQPDNEDNEASEGEGKLVDAWLKEIEEAGKREHEYRKEGNSIVDIYEGENKLEYQFNILYSNTETLLPALYNNTPRPIVQRRFKDADPVGLIAAKVAQRILEYQLDSGETGRSEFDELLEAATLESLLPGRGVTAFTYEAEVMQVPSPEGVEAPPTEQVEGECVEGRRVSWDNFLHGFAKTWKDVPWVGYQWMMTREELEKNFPELAQKIKLTVTGKDKGASSDSETGRAPSDSEGMKFAEVWEIWDKESKKVVFISPGYPAAPIKEVDDPLGLTGFFNCPPPLMFVAKVSSLVPTPLYKLYEEQAKELNRVSARINKLIGALKVRGFYDSTLEGLDQLMTKGDNSLLPAQNVAAMLQGQTLEKAIWLFPLEKLINVLQQLYVQRQQTKQVIYEITGISDILRGSSVASETATAQNIKNQWGTLRLKRMQKLVMRYVRNCLRLMVEIAVKKLSPQTIAAMTGIELPTNEQKGKAQEMLQMMQAQQSEQAYAAQAQGQPPPPQQPPPENLTKILSSPTWEDVLALLQNDLQRGYRIDIETNSTVDSEATEDKEDMGEFMNAIAQFMNGIGPMVTEGTMPFGAAKSMLLAIVRRYRFGTEVEDEINAMQPPQQPQQDPKAAAEMQKAQEELVKGQQELQAKSKEAALQQQMQAKQLEMQSQFNQREAQMQAEFARRELDLEKKAALQEIEFAKKASEMEISRKQQEASMAISAEHQGNLLKQQAQAEKSRAHTEAQKLKAGPTK